MEQNYRLIRAKITSTILKLYFITDRDLMHAYAYRMLQAGGMDRETIYTTAKSMVGFTTSHVARLFTQWLEKNTLTLGNKYILTEEQCLDNRAYYDGIFMATKESEVLDILSKDPYFRENIYNPMKSALIEKIKAATANTEDELRTICNRVAFELTAPKSPWVGFFPKKYTSDEMFDIFSKPEEIDLDARYLEIVQFLDTMQRMMYFVSQGLATLDETGFKMKVKNGR